MFSPMLVSIGRLALWLALLAAIFVPLERLFAAHPGRIFRMAPLHHHFELAGWPEPRVIVRFWIVTVILVLAGLATLKVR